MAAWHLAPLAWDGAYFLFTVLDTGAPFTPAGRTIHIPLQAPLLVARQLGADLATLRLLFALPYALVPAVGLALSWWVCRRSRPSLFVWPVLAVALGALPGQLFYTSEGAMAAALVWPILLTLLVGLRPAHLPLLAALGLAVWAAHPVAAALLGGAALLALVLARRDPGRRRLLGAVAAAGLLAAVARLLVPLTGYEAESLTPQRLVDSYRVAVAGWPAIALASLLAAAALTLAEPWLQARSVSALAARPPAWPRGRLPAWSGARARQALRYAPALLALGAGAALIPWARDHLTWAHALDYRFLLHPISLGLMLAAVADGLLVADRGVLERVWRGRRLTVHAAALALLVVLTLQSRSWLDLRTRFVESLALAPSVCAPPEALPDVAGTALDHWATASLAIALQGRAPERLALQASGCAELAATGHVRIAPWELRPGGRGWYQLPTSAGVGSWQPEDGPV